MKITDRSIGYRTLSVETALRFNAAVKRLDMLRVKPGKRYPSQTWTNTILYLRTVAIQGTGRATHGGVVIKPLLKPFTKCLLGRLNVAPLSKADLKFGKAALIILLRAFYVLIVLCPLV